MDYTIKPATIERIDEIYLANQRCFKRGESYSRKILRHLLYHPKTIGYCAVTSDNQLVAFIFATFDDDGTGNISTLGVLPEHRRKGLAKELISHVEQMLVKKNITTVKLEVRVSNSEAQGLYRQLGYTIVQRLKSYYSDGEDGFLMVKSLV